MVNNVLLVSSEPKSPERDEEYNAWFNTFHLQIPLKAQGVVAVTRYKVSRVQMDWMIPMVKSPQWPFGKDQYLNIYELDPGVDPPAIFQALREGEKENQTRDPDSDPVRWGSQLFYEAITEKETSAWIRSVPVKEHGSSPMPIWVVYSSAIPEAEEENNNWYLAQGNLRSAGFQSIIRYKLSATQGTLDSRGPSVSGQWPFGEQSNLAIWELDDPLAAANARRGSQGQAIPGPRYAWMPPLNTLRRGGEHIIFEPVTNRITPIWIRRD